MTKRKIVNDTADELPHDDEAEVEAGHLGDVPDAPNEAELEHDARTSDETAPMVRKSGGAAVVNDDDELVRVSIALPRGALVALLDFMSDPTEATKSNPLSNFHAAEEYGLIAFNDSEGAINSEYGNYITPIGELVRHGFDETAVRHKMNAAYRNAINANVDNGV